MLVAALARECAAAGGTLHKAGTRSTAMSQHCLCGQRVPKTLAQRTHHCAHCGLRADRDIVSAMLACCVQLADPDDPHTAWVDYSLPTPYERGWPPSKSGRAQSTGTSHHHIVVDRPGPAAATRWPLLSTQHSTHPRTDQAFTWTSRTQSKTTAPQADWRCMTPYGSTLDMGSVLSSGQGEAAAATVVVAAASLTG
jgi:hypothetical protein